MYLSKQAVKSAIEKISSVHPFFGITYLSAKKNELTVGNKMGCSIDTWNKAYLDTFHKINPNSSFYFQPFNSNARDKQWVNDRYPSTGLQAINTQTFRDAFLHERGERTWGWSENYITVLQNWISRFSQKLPAIYLAIWTLKDKEWPEGSTVTDILRAFCDLFHITEEEQSALFDMGINDDLDAALVFQDHLLMWSDYEDFVSLPPDLQVVEPEIPVRAISQSPTHYWLYAAGDNSVKWEEFYADGIMAIGWDEMDNLSQYPSKEAMKVKMKQLYGEEYSYKNSALATWQFAHEIKTGDVVFVKKGRRVIVGRGIVESEYIYDAERDDYRHIRKVCWTHKGEWEHPGLAVMKALTEITAYTDYVRKLEALIIGEDDSDSNNEELAVDYPPYSKEDFLSEVYMTEDQYKTLTQLLKYQKNIILQGAPGVGKTFAAKRLAYSLIGAKDTSRVVMVQFHQSYSYEDFIMGYRPSKEGFDLVPGPFYQFCKDAQDDDENDYYFLIDEINRGNLSKIFGELLMLIERDKRGEQLRLLYSNELFTVPHNVHIIGMMNTADRSLALIDYALRRRFAFYNLVPAFDSQGFSKNIQIANNPKYTLLVEAIKELNAVIQDDEALGKGFCIGHSYLCVDASVGDEWVNNVIEYEIIPLLEEYWFDDPEKKDYWSNRLRGIIK